MNDKFELPNPELEAEIYYLREEESGRKTPINSGYRGQFSYDDHDWDAPQEFIGKESCLPGEKVKVRLQTSSPEYHIGKFWVGKSFKIREGYRVVGEGTITKILREDFKHWDYKSTLKELSKNCVPYDSINIEGFIIDFDNNLETPEGIKEVNCEVNLSNKEEMIQVYCTLEDSTNKVSPFLLDEVCKIWREKLSFENSKYKIEANFSEENFFFILSFITWHSMYLTGKIIIRK